MDVLFSLRYWLLIGAISLIGTSANLANYYIGRSGSHAVFERHPDLEASKTWVRVNNWFQRWGSRTLALSAVPVLGTALAAAAGIFEIRMAVFLAYVIVGKIVRNWLLLLLFLGVLSAPGTL
jgi:membrane protein YqaA with SNARE-associated domain